MNIPEDITTYEKKEKSTDASKLDVECPHCFEENNIDLTSAIQCKKCEKPLLTKKDSKLLLSGVVAAFIGTGAIAGVMLDDITEIYKLPFKMKYKMTQTCLQEFSKNGQYTRETRDTCLCAVDTMDGLYDVRKIKQMDSFEKRDIMYERYEYCED